MLELASADARTLRDEQLRSVEASSLDELLARYNQTDERVLVDRGGRSYEVFTVGSWDSGPWTDFSVWIFVRPAWVARIPILRWVLSARAVHLRDTPPPTAHR